MNELLDTAIHAAREAGRVLREKLDQARTVDFKGDVNLVTDADLASEQVLLGVLRSRFPSHRFIAEESGGSGAGDFTWYVDPLDGTTNYAHGVPHFCVSVAVEGPGAAAGVVFDPMRDELFAAARGQGATLNGRPIRVTSAAALKRALLVTGFPYDLEAHPEAPLGLFNRIVTRAQGMRRFGSAALDLCWVAAGRFDGFFEFGLKPWDVAAGALIVEEAGGVVKRIDGGDFTPLYGDLVGAGAALAPELVRECADFVAQLGFVPRPWRG